jgi:hypothetical protein
MAILFGTTGPIGGTELLAAGCFTVTATVTGAAVGMPVQVTPRTFPGNGTWWEGYVSAPDTVTVKVCTAIAMFIGQSIYDVAVNNEATGGGVDSVTATSPIASSGGNNPNISYDGGTITMLPASALQGSATGWQLGTGSTPTRALLQPLAANTGATLVVAPSGTGTQATIRCQSSSDAANFGVLTFGLSGATASLQTSVTGTGTGISAFNVGESSGANLAAINFIFGGVAQASLASAGRLSFPTITGGLSLKTGSNARVGSGTLAAGTLAVPNTSVTANSLILVQNTGGGVLANVGALFIASQTAGVGFTVTSSNAADTSTFKYFIIETA